MDPIYAANVKAERRPLTPFFVAGLAALAFIGCFLDWATAFGGVISLQGTDADRGLITLALAGGIVLLAGLHLTDRLSQGVYSAVSMALAVTGCVLVVWTWTDIESVANVPEDNALFGGADLVDVGMGLYLTLIALVAVALTLTVEQARKAWRYDD